MSISISWYINIHQHSHQESPKSPWKLCELPIWASIGWLVKSIAAITSEIGLLWEPQLLRNQPSVPWIRPMFWLEIPFSHGLSMVFHGFSMADGFPRLSRGFPMVFLGFPHFPIGFPRVSPVWQDCILCEESFCSDHAGPFAFPAGALPEGSRTTVCSTCLPQADAWMEGAGGGDQF